MENIWLDIQDYCRWLILGPETIPDQSPPKSDLPLRLFIIVNAPFFIALKSTYWLSMTIATSMQGRIYSSLPARFKKLDGLLTFALYGALQVVTMGGALVYFVAPLYKFVFSSLLSLVH